MWQDRTGHRCSMPDASQLSVARLFYVFPCIVATPHLSSISQRKLLLYRSDLRPKSSGHHLLQTKSKALHISGTTFHFKWRASVVEKLKRRRDVYKTMKIKWWVESDKALTMIEDWQTNCTCAQARVMLPALQS